MKTFKELINEATFKLGHSVKIVGGPASVRGKEGHIGEIRHGAYKGAPKMYTIDHSPDDKGNYKSIQLPAEHIRRVVSEEGGAGAASGGAAPTNSVSGIAGTGQNPKYGKDLPGMPKRKQKSYQQRGADGEKAYVKDTKKTMRRMLGSVNV